MKLILLNLLGIAIVMTAGVSMAQYPEMTEEEIAALEGYTGMVPVVEFQENPTPCAAGDIECEALYLEVYGAYFQGFMQAQQQPSPIYSWESEKCILNSPEECGVLQGQWETWVSKANVSGLDFSQGANPEATPQCIDVGGTWFGLEPAYKCYEIEPSK